jgi:hypothetical protein
MVDLPTQSEERPVNISVALPQPMIRSRSGSQSVASAVISRLKGLVSAGADRDALESMAARPYSFLSECECPADCLRDHENE